MLRERGAPHDCRVEEYVYDKTEEKLKAEKRGGAARKGMWRDGGMMAGVEKLPLPVLRQA